MLSLIVGAIQQKQTGGSIILCPPVMCLVDDLIVPKYKCTVRTVSQSLALCCRAMLGQGDGSFSSVTPTHSSCGSSEAIAAPLRSRVSSRDHHKLAEGAQLIASVSQADGVVIMDTNYVIRSFGTMLGGTDFRVPATFAREASYRHMRSGMPGDVYGSRHAAVISFCHARSGALGIVVSSDGGVVMVTRVAMETLVWDNVALIYD
jgi:DNA integrity scanning protein DisA with diadenylate cyclase activity